MAKETDILLNGGITLVAKSFSEERPGQQLVEGLCEGCLVCVSVCLSVCLSVCVSVPALAASAFGLYPQATIHTGFS